MNLDVNNARVLSSYTDSRTVIQNGLLEWDAVDTNVNMPILNYKVNVNLPVYDSPSIYGPVMITNSGSYNIEDFVNADLTNYTWVNKNIPVIINVPQGSDGTVCYIKLGTTDISSNSHWTFYSIQSSVSVSSSNEYICITKSSDSYLISFILSDTSSQSLICPANSWVYNYNRVSGDGSTNPLGFYGSTNNLLFKLIDTRIDDYTVRGEYSSSIINFDGITWMTFD